MACEQAGVAKPMTTAGLVPVVKEGLKLQQEKPLQVVLVGWKAERDVAFSVRSTSSEGTNV